MNNYPFTPSQISNASAADVLAFLKSPTLVARRFAEIIKAQNFLSLFLLSGRYEIQGGAIAVPANEKIRTDRPAATVAPGAEYKLTPLSAPELEIYTSQKEGIATEIADEVVTRSRLQPVEDAFLMFQSELVSSADEVAMGVILSGVTQTVAGSAWTNGKAILKDATLVKLTAQALKLGYSIDTVVLEPTQYAAVLPEILDVVGDDANTATNGGFPTLGGMTWVPDDTGLVTDPLFVDRRRLGGIARERIESPEYRPVGGDTGVEIASIREPKADKTRLQARNPHVPVLTNPLAGFTVTGTR